MSLETNLKSIQARIAVAAERAGRDPTGVQLLAVSKNHPPEAVKAAADLGLTLFGENRVQEGKTKIPLCPGRLHWHMIGHLQSNKCRDAVQWFEMIQGVDSLALATELNRCAEKQARHTRILLEVNVAGESSKFGYSPAQVLAELDALNALPRLELHGLMTVAPWSEDPERVRPVFRKLADLHKACEDRLGVPLPILSMGMSGDFEVAIAEGSTLIRIGTALFGERPKIRRETDGP